MPDPDPEVSPALKRLIRWGEANRKTYSGFEPKRMKLRLSRVGSAIESGAKKVVSAPKDVVEDAVGVVKENASNMKRQASSDLRSVSKGLKKLKGRLGF